MGVSSTLCDMRPSTRLTRNIAGNARVLVHPPDTTDAGLLLVDDQVDVAQLLWDAVSRAVSGQPPKGKLGETNRMAATMPEYPAPITRTLRGRRFSTVASLRAKLAMVLTGRYGRQWSVIPQREAGRRLPDSNSRRTRCSSTADAAEFSRRRAGPGTMLARRGEPLYPR